MIGIADAMCNLPEITGGIYTASLTRRSVNLSYAARNIFKHRWYDARFT